MTCPYCLSSHIELGTDGLLHCRYCGEEFPESKNWVDDCPDGDDWIDQWVDDYRDGDDDDW